MKYPLSTAAALAIAAVSAFVSTVQPATAQPSEADCLQPMHLNGWKVLDDRTVIITDQARHPFKLSLAPGCTGLQFSFGLGLKSFNISRLECISHGDSVVVPAGGGMPRQNCMINTIQAYTPEMQHADAVAKAMDKPH
jgi:hypothetical protein